MIPKYGCLVQAQPWPDMAILVLVLELATQGCLGISPLIGASVLTHPKKGALIDSWPLRPS